MAHNRLPKSEAQFQKSACALLSTQFEILKLTLIVPTALRKQFLELSHCMFLM
jgi:hypothetical protein